MNARPMRTHARTLLVAAALLGVAGDLLLRGGMWRLGLVLWITALVVGTIVMGGRSAPADRNLLLVGTLLASLGLVWRDSPMLYAVDMMSIACTGALVAWLGSGKKISQLTVIDSVRAALLAVVNAIGGALGLLQQGVAREGDAAPAASGRARALAIGAILAVPPFFIVTSLLSSSDKVFEALVDRIGDFLANDALQHVLISLVLAWLTAGWLRAALGNGIRGFPPEVNTPSVPFLTVSVGLYALIAVLALFLVTQAQVLFGGAEFLQQTAGLTVAAYAREGFFQLVVASGVVLGTLIIAEWLLDAGDTIGRRRYQVAGSVLLVLVAALLVSAVVRILLYVGEFGLSIDRAFACAVMVWVVVALVVFAATTLRNRADLFAPATLVATVVWVTLLNIVNLEAIVVRTNIARAQRGESFDVPYHAKLSADALPALLDAAPGLMPVDCQALADALAKRWGERLADADEGGIDWRSRSVPLANARAWHNAGARVNCKGS